MAQSTDIEYFDLRIVHDHFDRSLMQDGDVELIAYLEAYNELYKFFQLMGTVFGFVSSDLKQKIDILQKLVVNDQENYISVKKMVIYEKDNNILQKSDYINGARTLLRLHRGLDFILEFLKQLSEIADDENTATCCKDAYNKTLAKHHPWIIRKAAGVAMYTMPNKDTLFKKVCGENAQRNIDVLPKMLEVTANVVYRIRIVYEKHELHSLP